jgi:hypothetical protein
MKIKFSLIIVRMLSTSTISVLYKKLFDILSETNSSRITLVKKKKKKTTRTRGGEKPSILLRDKIPNRPSYILHFFDWKHIELVFQIHYVLLTWKWDGRKPNDFSCNEIALLSNNVCAFLSLKRKYRLTYKYDGGISTFKTESDLQM